MEYNYIRLDDHIFYFPIVDAFMEVVITDSFTVKHHLPSKACIGNTNFPYRQTYKNA